MPIKKSIAPENFAATPRTDRLSAATPSLPPQGLGHWQKRHSSREPVRPRRHLSQILPSTPEYKPQMGQPASFNPELCGGLRASRTLPSSS